MCLRLCLRLVPALCFALIPTSGWSQHRPAPIEVVLGERSLSGSPLAQNDKSLWLLRPDGRLTQIDRSRITATNQKRGHLVPISFSDLHRQLGEEFGSAYQVSITTHFVVVHPPGDHQYWAEPFERLYHQFRAYFERRGTELPRCEFPLVAVVLNTRGEFDRFLARYGAANGQVVGYYSPTSNRVITYREAGEPAGRGGGFLPSTTVIHEVAHQAAFNTGIHSRFAATPRWMSEGLAVLFEARGVHNSLQFGRLADRKHEKHAQYLRKAHSAGETTGLLPQIVQDDRLFETNPEMAYALAWGLTFYVTETGHADYIRLLRLAASKRDFQAYSSAERLRDFQSVFGTTPQELEPRLWHYLLSH